MAQGTQVLDRAAAIVALVVRSEEPMSFSEVVDATELAKSTVSRLLNALEGNGLLARGVDGLYRAGALFATYAAQFGRIESLVTTAQPVLESIGEETGETVNLALPSGDQVVQAAQVDSTYVLGAANWVNVEVPPHTSAPGKVLLAHGAIGLPDGPLEGRTPATVTDRSALDLELANVRERGFAVTHGELEEGLEAIAAPVHGPDGAVVAAISISGPATRISNHEELGRLLLREARMLSRVIATQRTAPQIGDSGDGAGDDTGGDSPSRSTSTPSEST